MKDKAMKELLTQYLDVDQLKQDVYNDEFTNDASEKDLYEAHFD